MTYTNWRKRLEVAKLPTVAARRAELTRLGLNSMEPTHEDEGYYRIPITEKDASGNGKNIIIGYTPVALFLDGNTLVGVRGTEQTEMNPVQVVDSWTWFCSHPISYDIYKSVAENGEPWLDLKLVMVGPSNEAIPANTVLEGDGSISLTPSGARITDNQPPAEPDKPKEPDDVRFAKAIDAAISAAATLVVDSAEADAIAQGSKNRIAEIRLAGAKIGKAKYEPLLRVYEAERNKWLPVINRAADAEKGIERKILTFRDGERRRLAAIAAAQAAAQARIDEENERAAQRAIAKGQPEPAPVAPPEVPPAASAPAPVAPTYGTRKVKEELKKFAVIEDDVEVYKFFAANPDVRELLQKLATNAIRSGLTVPGTTTREGLI